MEMIWRAVIAVVLALVIGQVIKVIYETIKNNKYNARYWLLLGGMPSTHTSSVAALSTAVYFETGISLLLLITLVFAIIVARDACGIRIETEKACKELNKILKRKVLSEDLGHTCLEVFAGALLGIAIAVIIYVL